MRMKCFRILPATCASTSFPAIQLDAETRVGKSLCNGALHFKGFLLFPHKHLPQNGTQKNNVSDSPVRLSLSIAATATMQATATDHPPNACGSVSGAILRRDTSHPELPRIPAARSTGRKVCQCPHRASLVAGGCDRPDDHVLCCKPLQYTRYWSGIQASSRMAVATIAASDPAATRRLRRSSGLDPPSSQ